MATFGTRQSLGFFSDRDNRAAEETSGMKVVSQNYYREPGGVLYSWLLDGKASRASSSLSRKDVTSR